MLTTNNSNICDRIHTSFTWIKVLKKGSKIRNKKQEWKKKKNSTNKYNMNFNEKLGLNKWLDMLDYFFYYISIYTIFILYCYNFEINCQNQFKTLVK